MREFVDERLGRKRVGVRRRRTPRSNRDRDVDEVSVDEHVRDRVREVAGSPHPRGVDAVRQTARTLRARRLYRKRVMVGGDRPIRGEHGRDRIHRTRTIRIVANVVLARPDNLDRDPGSFRNLDRVGDVVLTQPPAEAAAQQRRLHDDGGGREATRFHRCLLRGDRRLRRRPDGDAVGTHVGRRVHRFHRRVRRVRDFIRRDDRRSGAEHRERIAGLLHHRAGRPHSSTRRGIQGRRGNVRIRARCPPDAQGLAALKRRPRIVRDHRDAGRNRDHLAHAGNPQRVAVIDRGDRRADLAWLLDRGELHPRHDDVEPIDCGPVRLPEDVEPARTRSEQHELRRRLEPYRGRDRKRRGKRNERTARMLRAGRSARSRRRRRCGSPSRRHSTSALRRRRASPAPWHPCGATVRSCCGCSCCRRSSSNATSDRSSAARPARVRSASARATRRAPRRPASRTSS